MDGILKEPGRFLRIFDLLLQSGSIHTFLSSDQFSHSSRTALLRLIAGLEHPTTGRIYLNGKDITSLRPGDRRVAMVYEEFINYPHLSVFENIASPLKVQGKYRSGEIREKVRLVAETLHLTPFLTRMPSQLSGGQQQRVCLARALVKEAQLVLLDNPLANLDFKLREELREEFRQLFSKGNSLGNSLVLYATADPHEALSLGGRTYVLKEGTVLQYGEALEVYHHPMHRDVAAAVSDPPMNFIPGEREGGKFTIAGAGQHVLGLRPQDFIVGPVEEDILWLDGEITMVEMTGMDTMIHFIVSGRFPLIWERPGVYGQYDIGEKIRVGYPSHKILVFDEKGTRIWPPLN